MLNRHALAGEVGPRLIENVDGHSEALHALEKVERRLEALLAEHGVSDPSELPRAVQVEILRRAMLDTAVTHFPMADLETLDHHARSLPHPAFILACERVRLATKQGSDAFAAARGVHAAVALAGFGLPVAPFDLATSRISAKPSNDIDTVLELFSADQGAFIGYNVCAAPFYVLLTDCVRTLRRLVLTHPALSEVKLLFERPGASLPPDPGHSFKHGMTLSHRQPGDTISTVAVLDPNQTGGSIMLYAGWQVENESYGALNNGYFPVPTQLLRAVVYDPKFASALCWRVGFPPAIH